METIVSSEAGNRDTRRHHAASVSGSANIVAGIDAISKGALVYSVPCLLLSTDS